MSLRKTRFLSAAIALFLGVSILLPTLANNISGVANAEVQYSIRDYSALEDTERLMIGGHYGADCYTDEGIALLKESGLDFTSMFGNHAPDYNDINKVKTIYDKLHAEGLKVLLFGLGGQIPSTLGMKGTVVNGQFDYSSITPTDEQYGTISELGLGLSYTDVVLGTEWGDEPTADLIQYIDDYIDRYEEAFPGKQFYANLLPDYGFNTNSAFNAYVENYATTVIDKLSGEKILSLDTYPYQQNGVTQPKHFTSLATAAIVAKNHGANLSLYVQSMNPGNSQGNLARDVYGQADMDMQYSVAMAFGAKQIVNFCYETPEGFNSTAMLDEYGNKTNRFTWVKNAVATAHYIGQAYMRFGWNGTIISIGTDNNRFASNNCFSQFSNSFYNWNSSSSLVPNATTYSSQSATRSTLSDNNLLSVASSRTGFVGCFTDDAGYNGYMVASGDDAKSGAATAFALTFDNSTDKVRIYKGTSYTDENLTNHTLNLGLNAGEGAFVVPFKARKVNNVTIQVEGLDDEVIKVEEGGSFTLPDRISGSNSQKALVGYIHRGALYPVGYTINNITSDETVTAVFADLTMQRGASVRIDSDKEHAIRWKANISKADYDNLKKKYTVQGYGFTIMSKSRKGALNIEVPFDKFVEGDNNDYVLAGVMTNVEDADLCEVFEARAFVKIRFSNGVTKRIYARGNENERSIAYVAAMALADDTMNWSPEKAERLRLLSASYTHDDNIGSLNDWIDQTNGDNVGSLDYWLRLLAQNGN